MIPIKSLVKKGLKRYHDDGVIKLIIVSILFLRRKLLLTLMSTIAVCRDDLRSRCRKYNAIWSVSESESVEITPPEITATPPEFESILGTHKSPESFVCELSDVTIIGPWGVCITPTGRPLMEPMGVPLMLWKRLNHTVKHLGLSPTLYHIIETIVRQSPVNKHDTAIHLIPRHGEIGAPNYSHWLCENLPQLKAIHHYRAVTNSDPTLLIGKNPPTFVTETLRHLGYSEENWVTWENEKATFDTLIIPKLSYTHSFGTELDPCGRRWVRNRIKEDVDCSNVLVDTSKYIYFSREGANDRNIVNFGEVKSRLQQLGFKFYSPEKLSVAEEIKLTSEADILVGPIGANLLGYAISDNLDVLSIHNGEHIQGSMTHFFIIANELDIGYEAFEAQSNDQDSDIAKRDRDLIVDVEKLAQVINRMKQESENKDTL